MELRDAVVVITGASSGYGELAAVRFARAGARVTVAARREDRLLELAGGLGRAGSTVLAVRCDVTERSDIDSLRDRVLDAFGRCDVLVNNAGIAGTGRFEHQDPEFLERLVRTNLLGVVLTTKAFLPTMVEAGRGHVVNVASIAGRLATPGLAVYGATKHAVVAFSEALNYELASRGILVTTVNPWLSKTEGFPQRQTPRWLLVDADRVARVIVDVVRKDLAPNALDRPLRLRIQAIAFDRWVGERHRDLAAHLTLHRLDPGLRQSVHERGSTHLGEVERPGARNDVGPQVAAAAGREPPSFCHLVRKRVELGGGFAVRTRRQPQVRERVAGVRIAAELGHEHRRLERAHDGEHDRPERTEPRLVRCAGWKRDVHLRPDSIAGSSLFLEAGTREQVRAGLVQRDGEDTRVVVEDRLRAVAVVHVDVDVGNTFGAFAQEPRDGNGGIVVHAEPRGSRGHRVVQTARRVERVSDGAIEGRARRDDGRTRDERTGLVHLREDGIVARPVAEPLPVAVLAVPRSARRVDELRGVDELELGVIRRATLQTHDVGASEQAARLDELPRIEHSLWSEGMSRTVVVDPGLGTDDEACSAAHPDVATAAMASAVRSTMRRLSSSVIVNGGPSISRSPSPSMCPTLE